MAGDDEQAAYIDGYAHALYAADTYGSNPWESCDEDEKAAYRAQALHEIEASRRAWVAERGSDGR